MYTWEAFFGKKIDESRKKEMKIMMKTLYLKIVLIITSLLCSKIGFYALIITYIWLNNNASAEVIFYLMKCFGTLRHTISFSISIGMTRIAELSASLNRINKVLRAEELLETVEKPTDNPKIEMKEVKVAIKDKTILRNISVNIQNGLTVVTGQLGCGKSSLMKVILKDYPIDEGSLITTGRKSYASQDPWLFPSSIKQNILFGEAYDVNRYQNVIKVCALEYDFSLLEKGDETIVADRGLNLSKGQQARINLARAIYKDSDIYLIDDSLTALDSHVQEVIFNECIRGFLKDKLCVLVTHNAKHISNADKVIILENGMVKFEGKDQDISRDLLTAIEEEDLNEKDVEEEEISETSIDEKTKLLKGDCQKRRQVYHEIKKTGSVSTEVYIKYFKFGGGFILFALVIFMYFGSQFTESYSSKLLTNCPIVGHLNASMEGLTTIRAYRAQNILKNEFDRHQDVYTSAHYISFCTKRAFAFYMDLSSVLFLSIIVGRFLFFDIDTAAGDVGLAITQAASLAMVVQWGLMQWAEAESLMTSVERVLEYTELKRETSSGIEIKNWPSKGEINYVNVSLTYANTNERVLKNICFTVKSKKKIGIVGRTGAGKSSIISTLFRLYNYEGQIFIDDVEIKTLSLEFLRQHISIIPQDPIMFAGTIRSNIDPLQKYTDEEIWKTIHKIQLENMIPSLDYTITDNNSDFSTGQRQLIYEATSNMDPDTEFLIQKAIVENFSACTVFIIAHRLQSILDCHKVMVMEKGEIVEFEDPLALMEDKTSTFSRMLKNAGLNDTM
ncbi:hypothetical protein NQ314_019642 [Rhamnusium bicolor]|uniref:ABC transporter domain-containing protein n=1 Tax=Rhamnusium bicolor TaxID=1586634 RepID=A0AAV8WNG6_9CUCU|nr:hypothetical protein NQ314_019642 [Rhamnusium bicolor]